MSKQILEGVKILDLTAVVAGPMASALLGDFGADVIRVEIPRGDGLRSDSGYFNLLQRNKRVVTMDFHHEEGLEYFYKLVKWADVVVANFRPQTLKRFKIDYEDCVKHNPEIIYMSLTAYGRTGPYKDRPGYARVVEAYTSLPYMTGWPDRPPSLSGSWIADGVSGIYMAWLITMALLHKEKTGEGQLIDLGLYEPFFRLLEDVPVKFSEDGKERMRRGNMHHLVAPNNLYRTSDGHWMAMPINLSSWPRLLKAMGREDLLEDPRCDTKTARYKNREFVDELTAKWVESKTRDELMALALEYEFACGPVNSTSDVMNDPHMWERGTLVKYHDERRDKDLIINGITGIFSKTPGRMQDFGHFLGEDNEAVYKGMLGMSDEEYVRLKETGAI